MTSDQLHRLLLDNLNTAVLLLNSDLIIDYSNPAAEALMQASSMRLCGLSAAELFVDTRMSLSTLQEVLSSGSPHTRRHEHLRLPSAERPGRLHRHPGAVRQSVYAVAGDAAHRSFPQD